jgi:hypothetical protein
MIAPVLIIAGMVAFAVALVYLIYIRIRYRYSPTADNDRRAKWVSRAVILSIIGLFATILGAVFALAKI